MFGPNSLRNLPFQDRRDDEVRRVLSDGVKHYRFADSERRVDNMSALGQFDQKPLTEAIMRCGEKKYFHQSLPLNRSMWKRRVTHHAENTGRSGSPERGAIRRERQLRPH